MRRFHIHTITVLMPLILTFLILFCLPAEEAQAKVRRIIRESSMSTDYLPGKGTPIGMVREVYGKVFIMHQEMTDIFRAREGYELYAGDTLTTKQTGRLAFVLKDDSEMTLAPNTTMVLNESVFDPASQRRTGLINLIAGKARFFVKKFADFRYSTFSVQTKTSIAAVRGSEFIIEQVGDQTIITALGMTVLSVTNPSFPLAEPILVTSFQQLIVALDEMPGSPFNVSEDQLREILDSLNIPADDDDNNNGGNNGDDDSGDDDDDDDDDGGDGSAGSGQSTYNDQSVSPIVPQ